MFDYDEESEYDPDEEEEPYTLTEGQFLECLLNKDELNPKRTMTGKKYIHTELIISLWESEIRNLEKQETWKKNKWTLESGINEGIFKEIIR